jgi:SAM-dependent methyltransferase
MSQIDNNRIKKWKNGRILYYYREADANFWDDHWEKQITKIYYKKYEAGSLDEIAPFIEKYLHNDDVILEAGCGTARYIVALRSRGFYNVQGIDWGPKTIKKVKSVYPDLPIKVGDATDIRMMNNFCDGYLSLGVVEHREDGPEPFLLEAFRVLKPGGYSFITIPYINPLRNLKRCLGFYRKINDTNTIFYQYAFSKFEFRKFLEKTGFEILEDKGIAGYFGIKEELPILFVLLDHMPGGWKIKQYLKKSNWTNFFGHLIMFVCKKKS